MSLNIKYAKCRVDMRLVILNVVGRHALQFVMSATYMFYMCVFILILLPLLYTSNKHNYKIQEL